jgi:integrase/recombinase XerD
MRLAIILLYTTGIRRGELLRLTPGDYDSSAQTLLIRASKFHKSRLLPLPGDVAAEIAQFLQLHQSLGLGAETPLLCGPYGKSDQAYSGYQLRKNLGRLLSLTEIKKADCRFIPRKLGGKEAYYNMQLIHRHCHDIKTKSDPDEW